jgi:hypothetical protein
MPFSSKTRPAYIGSPLNRSTTLAEGLMLRWPLIGLGIPDQVGGALLTKTGVTVAADPFAGMVSNFSGTAYYDTALSVPFNSLAYSTACWCMTNTTASSGGGGGLRYVMATETGAPTSFTLRYSPGGGVFQSLILGFSGTSQINSSGTVAAYSPYLLVTTFNPIPAGGTMEFFVNGVSQGTQTTGGDAPSNKVMTIGSDGGFDSRNRQWSGWISDVMIWNRDLSASDVWALYDPRSRWDLYWQPNTRAYSFMSAIAAGTAGYLLVKN